MIPEEAPPFARGEKGSCPHLSRSCVVLNVRRIPSAAPPVAHTVSVAL